MSAGFFRGVACFDQFLFLTSSKSIPLASLTSVAAVLSPLVMTGVFRAATDEAGVYLPGAPYFFSFVLALAMLPLVMRLRRRPGPR